MSCLPWDRFPLWMGWVCGPPFQRDEIGSLGSQEEARVLGSQVNDFVLCSLLVGRAAGPGRSPALARGCGEEVMQPPLLLQHCPTAYRALVCAWETVFHQVPICSCLEMPALALQGQAGPAAPGGGEHVAPLLLQRSHLLLGLYVEEMCFHRAVPAAWAPHAVTKC